jgi:transcriptional regulator with GAF, ATPase, and Fis domain
LTTGESLITIELQRRFQNLLDQLSIQHGKIGLLGANGKYVHFFDNKCNNTCDICAKAAASLCTKSINNQGCFSSDINTCMIIPFSRVRINTSVAVLGWQNGIINNKEVVKRFNKYSEQLVPYIHRIYLTREAEKRFGKSLIIVGVSQEIIKIQEQAERFASTNNPVLITGETGTGKEIVARSIHLFSSRWDRPFLALNCGQFADRNMLRSEFFGHVKGSFTGANRDHVGIFERVNSGTIFLDEIGELSVEVQAMLLRVLEEKEVQRVGESHKIRRVDFRLVVATNKNLTAMIEAGKFREDLYHRLNVLHIHVPPLRERGNDWKLLVNYFLKQNQAKYGMRKHFSNEALELLSNYHFRGNVRELRNIVSYALLNSQSDVIDSEVILQKISGEQNKSDQMNEINDLITRMREKGESFWDVVRKPFLKRDLNRVQVKKIIINGLKFAGSYKALTNHFNIPAKEYKKLMNFLNNNDLKP